MDFYGQIKEHINQELPFVLYKEPGSQIVKAVLQRDSAINQVDNFNEKGFVFAPFLNNSKPVLIRPDQFLEMDFKTTNLPSLPPGKHKETKFERDRYEQLVKKAIDEISRGTFDKVVLSRQITINFHNEPILIFQRLLAQFPNAFCYCWCHPEIGLWVGASPETLLHFQDGCLKTVSLAGTQKRIADKKPEWTEKERKEQEIVTRYIVKALRNKVKNLQVTKPESITAGSLWHLRTEITGTTTMENLSAIIRELHPTPAVCGLPLPAARKFIVDNENYSRSFYTGYLGELNFGKSDNTHLYVNLRCMELLPKKLKIYVGGGIIEGSDPGREWEETVHKSEIMKSVLFNSGD